MSKKLTIILSVVFFIILCALLVCERMSPEAGSLLIQTILGH